MAQYKLLFCYYDKVSIRTHVPKINKEASKRQTGLARNGALLEPVIETR